MMKMKPLLFVAIGAFLIGRTQAQSPEFRADSLRNLLRSSKADTNRVNLLRQLSDYYILKPGELAHDLDTALLMTRQAYSLSQSLRYPKGQGDAQYAFFQIWLEKGDFKQARLYAQRAMDFYARCGYWDQLAYTYMNQARFYNIDRDELPKKIDRYEKALVYFKRAGDQVKQADVYKEMADLHQIQENYAQALTELQSALTLFRAVGHTDLETVYDLLGFVSTKLGDYKEGLAFGLLAVRAAEARKDSSLQLCTIYNRVGLTHYALGQFKQANTYFRKSLAVAQRYNSSPYVLYLAGNIASLFLQEDKPKQALSFLKQMVGKYPPTTSESHLIVAIRFLDIYSELKEFTQAQVYCNRALDLLAKKGNGSLGQAQVYQSAIRFFINSKQYDQARHYLRINEAHCRKNGSTVALSKNQLLWFKLDSTQANYHLAIRHYQRYKVLQDSLLNATKSRQIAQLEIQYEIEKKDQDLKLNRRNIQLLTEQSQLQKSQLQQARTIRNGIIAGTIMLILLLGLGYNRYQIKQQSNKLLEAKQLEINQKNQSLQKVVNDKDQLLEEREWMLREIHHRVKNNLQIINSLLHSQAAFLKDEAALSAIRESQNRVHAMTLIHQKLYQSDRLAIIPMVEYIAEIIDYLITTFDRQDTVRKQILVTPVELDITLAVPLGLIINEAVTNSLKHAFPAGRLGIISLELTKLAGHTYQLRISDDGVGLPADFSPTVSRTLGMSLIRGLSKQLGGTLEIIQNNGVQISLAFSEEKIGQEELAKA
jgi:two-component sensor histidine kinase